jgi:hypothetical protein
MTERLGMVSPVEVRLINGSYNTSTRELTISVDAHWFGPASGDLRFNVYVIEDHVIGTGTGYNQVNYYNTVSGHPYFGAGNPILNFDHRNVVRAMLGGAWGTAGSMPSSVNDGDIVSYTYTTILDPSWDVAQIKLVGLAERYSADKLDREIFNSVDAPLALATGMAQGEVLGSSIVPNPFSTSTHIRFEMMDADQANVQILDLQGRVVNTLFAGTMSAGVQDIVWNGTDAIGNYLANGVYLVRVQAGDATNVQKVVLNR